MKQRIVLDSNIIIYAVQPEYEMLRQTLTSFDLTISKISIIETLGDLT